MSSFSMLRTSRQESKTKPTKNDILPFTRLAFNSCRPKHKGPNDDLFFVSVWRPLVLPPIFPLKNGAFQKQKKVFSKSSCVVPSTSLVVWASFFGTVLFLVNENMAPLCSKNLISKHCSTIWYASIFAEKYDMLVQYKLFVKVWYFGTLFECAY